MDPGILFEKGSRNLKWDWIQEFELRIDPEIWIRKVSRNLNSDSIQEFELRIDPDLYLERVMEFEFRSVQEYEMRICWVFRKWESVEEF